MSAAAVTRTKEELLLLAASVAGLGIAGLSAREAVPIGIGPVLGTAAALGVAGASAFAYWLGRVARGTVVRSDEAELSAARELLSAIPDGLLVVQDGRVRSVNRRLCELLGFERAELLGEGQPFPFWPPELRHELEAWHESLGRHGELEGELTLRRRNGERLHVAVAGRRVPDDSGSLRHVLTVRDMSSSRRRERRLAELCGRDPETGLHDHLEFERLLGGAVRRASAYGETLTLVLLELSVDGHSGAGVFGRPGALVAVERLQELSRVDDALARTGDGELAWILPHTDMHGGVGAVARARTALASLSEIGLTAGICDLATAGDPLALCAFADRALIDARQQGVGGTAQYRPAAAA
jgi:PAS domain S-box-containing protein